MFDIKVEGPFSTRFNRKRINESRFDIVLSGKNWKVEEQNSTLILHWISQEYEPYYEKKVIPRFMKEMKRYFNEVKPESIDTIEVIVYCRDNYPEILYKESFKIGDEYHYTDEELYQNSRFIKWKALLDENKIAELSEELDSVYSRYNYSIGFHNLEIRPFMETVIRDNPNLKSKFSRACKMVDINF